MIISSSGPKIFTPHSEKQEQAILSDNNILLLATGTQWGKSRLGALRMKMKIHEHTNWDDHFIITAPTYKILKQSTLPAFLYFMDGFGSYNKQDDTFYINGGGKVFCRTETDPDSIVGITNVKHIWGDESGKYGLYFWENIQARADFCGCGIDLTTSPYSINWIYKEIIKPKLKGLRKDVDYITAASWENPYHSLADPEKRKAKEDTMDGRRFRMIFGGQFEKMEGLVYDCFNQDVHEITPLLLPTGTEYYAGVDWGYSPDPFALVIIAKTPSGKRFMVSEFKKTRLTISDQIKVAKMKAKTFGIKRFYADPSRPDAIEEFNRQGLPCVGADNSIRKGLDNFYDLIKSGSFYVFKDACPHFIDEIEMYHYPEEEDLGPDDDSKEQLPVGQCDHVLDATRYVLLETANRDNKSKPKVPDEKNGLSRDIEQKIKQLKKLKNMNSGSENF